MKKDATQGDGSLSAFFDFKERTTAGAFDRGGLAELAGTALLAEVWATPKPGLVDRENNGAHKDMNFAMFEASAKALTDCFRQCAEAGGQLRHDVSAMAAALRSAGLAGERSMYAATGGVNTHKGAVFSMGILCAAAAMNPVSQEELQENCRLIAETLLDGEKSGGELTHGQQVRRDTGIGGIRAEALGGFDSAFSTGLPALEEALKKGVDFNGAMIYALLRIMAATQDSNVAYRGGKEGTAFAQSEAVRLTAEGPLFMELEAVRNADEEFIKRNLSPGGAADLLAFSVMLWFLRKEAKYD